MSGAKNIFRPFFWCSDPKKLRSSAGKGPLKSGSIYIRVNQLLMITMVELTPEMKEMFAKAPVYPLATASKDGVPNVAPMKSVWLIDDRTIWVADNYMNKSLANMRENPKAAIYIWGPETKGCIQIKGDVEILTAGPEYEKMRADVKAKSDKYPAKSLIRITITDVYSCAPGAGAGNKLL